MQRWCPPGSTTPIRRTTRPPRRSLWSCITCRLQHVSQLPSLQHSQWLRHPRPSKPGSVPAARSTWPTQMSAHLYSAATNYANSDTTSSMKFAVLVAACGDDVITACFGGSQCCTVLWARRTALHVSHVGRELLSVCRYLWQPLCLRPCPWR